MARPPDRSVPAYDRWVRTEEVPQSTPGRRLQDGRQRGQQALVRFVAQVLRAPDHGLLHALNAAAGVHPTATHQGRPVPRLRVLETEDPTALPAPAAPGLVRGGSCWRTSPSRSSSRRASTPRSRRPPGFTRCARWTRTPRPTR
jgi:hypothetical protein